MVFTSTLYSYALLDVPSNAGDFLESIKYIKFLPFLLALSDIPYEDFYLSLRRIINISSIWIIFVGFMQLFHPAGLGLSLASLYADEIQTSTMSGDVSRLLLTGSDPNVGAVISFFYFLINILLYWDAKKLFNLIVAIILITMMTMTQSRTAILVFVISITLYASFISKYGIYVKMLVILSFLLIIGLFAKLIENSSLEYLVLGFTLLASGENTSINVRLENIEFAQKLFMVSPIFGWGPAKSIHPTVIDSEYALIVARYGLVGVVLFGFYSINIIIKANKIIRSNVLLKPTIPIAAVIFMFFGVTVMSSNNIYSGYQLFSLLIVLSIGLRSLEVSFKREIK